MKDCPSCNKSFNSVAAMKSHHTQVHGESMMIDQEWRNSQKWKKLRKEALERDNYSCSECGKEENLHVHHKNPVCRGGEKFEIRNLRTLCEECHTLAHRKV